MHRILAGLIAVLLAGALATAIVKHNNESTPVVIGSPSTSPSPSQTYTFNGPPPTVPASETPVIPPTTSPTATVKGLPNTGSSSPVAVALVMLGLALAGGVAILRTARDTR